jgi:hypothetical protein
MAYFNFNYVTNPPADELVNEVTQLNNNWSEIELKTAPFNQMPANFAGVPIPGGIPLGTEAFDPDPADADPNRIAVWNGTIWARSINHQSAWGAWQTLGLRAPIVARPGFPPKAKIDAIARHVVLTGGVQLNATADPMGTTTYEITDDVSIQNTLAPANGGQSRQFGAAAALTGAGTFSNAMVLIDNKTGPNRTAISVRWQGDAGGGNFVMLDGVEWWY